MKNLIEATLSADSPRYETWLKVFGRDRVPLMSPFEVEGTLEGEREKRRFLFVKVDRLTVDQFERVVQHISETWGRAPDLVKADLISQHGLPILADDVIVAMDLRAFL